MPSKWVVPRKSVFSVPLRGAVFSCPECFPHTFQRRHGPNVPQSIHGHELRRARKGSAGLLEARRHHGKKLPSPRRRGAFHLLRRPAHGQRPPAHRPHRNARHQGPDSALPEHEGQGRPAQGRLGYARPARGAGGGKAAGPGRQAADRGLRHRALHRRVQKERMEVSARVGGNVRPCGLLGGYEEPLHHLQGRLYRVRVVEPEGDLEKRPALQGLQGRALLPPLRHRALQPRGRAGLQGGQRRFGHGSLQGRRP